MAGNLDKICRTCLNFVDADKAVSINQHVERLSLQRTQLKDIIEQCVSELDLDVSNDAVICHPCYDALKCTYTFKLKCIQTEEKIYSYLERNNLGLGVKIDLLAVVKNGEGEEDDDMIVVSDSDSSQEVIHLSDGECENEEALETITNTNPAESVVISDDGAARTYPQNNKESSSTLPTSSNEQSSCVKCQYKTSRKESLQRHVDLSTDKVCKHVYQICERNRSDVASQKKPYLCGICDRVLTDKAHLKMHILCKHSDLTLPLTCRMDNCQSTFQKKSDFNNHIIKHRYKPFMCQLCNKGFLNESQWDVHLENDHGICCVGE